MRWIFLWVFLRFLAVSLIMNIKINGKNFSVNALKYLQLILMT